MEHSSTQDGEKSLERPAFHHTFEKGRRISVILPQFLDYARYDQRLSTQTLVKYKDCVKRFIGLVGDGNIEDLTPQHFLEVKRRLFDKGLGEARVASVIFAMKSLLKYCRSVARIEALDPDLIRPPRKLRRDVIYLTTEEVDQFLGAIPLDVVLGLRFRVLCEVLLGTATRISEAMSLDRDKIDFFRREAKVVGKGNKERVVFFTERSLEWVKRYLMGRRDRHPALFITSGEPRRLRREDLWRAFGFYAKRAGITKKVTAHILRHTAATHLLFNGCPIAHVKEILGHERLETTCKYYLGLDRNEAKSAHERFMRF